MALTVPSLPSLRPAREKDGNCLSVASQYNRLLQVCLQSDSAYQLASNWLELLRVIRQDKKRSGTVLFWNDMRIAVVDLNIGTESVIRPREATGCHLSRKLFGTLLWRLRISSRPAAPGYRPCNYCRHFGIDPIIMPDWLKQNKYITTGYL